MAGPKLKGIPIRLRLPLIIGGTLLLFALAAFLAAFTEVRASALESAHARLTQVTGQLAEMLAEYTGRSGTQLRIVAARPQILEYLANPNAATHAAARTDLDTIERQSEPALSLQIYNSDRSLILSLPDTAGSPPPMEAAAVVAQAEAAGGSPVIGAMMHHVDSDGVTHAMYQVVVPVVRDSLTLGYLAMHRIHSASAQEMQRIRGLIGSGVVLDIGSPETGVWTDLEAIVPPPPAMFGAADSLLQYRRDDGTRYLAMAQSISGTPWLALVEFPRAPVLAGATRFAQRFAIAAAILLLVGAGLAISLTRSISRPLEKLAQGALSISQGDYSRRFPEDRRDEIGDVSRAFNTMSASVAEYVHRLDRELVEREKTADAMRAAEELVRAIVNASPLPIVAQDARGKVELWNSAAETLFGHKATDVVGRDFPYNSDEERELLIALHSSAMDGDVLQGREIRIRTPGGKNVLLSVTGAATYSSSSEPRGVTLIFDDVTRSRSLEEQVRHSQKMEAVGRLAGGIAHDFNNLLTVVLGASDMLLHEDQGTDTSRASIMEIRDSAQRAAALTSQLLSLSRKQVSQAKVFSLERMVDGMNSMMKRVLGEHIRIIVRTAPDLGMVEADQGQIEQVLLNLVVNARDAMPNGGVLAIQTDNAQLDEGYTSMHSGVESGEYVALSVSDNGTGMSAETLSQIFEPYFTTKAPGKGTGLGLATCYGIARQAGGHIGVYSELGVGTTVKVYLPRVAAERSVQIPEAKTAVGGSEVIFLVEDNKAVRDVAQRMLQGLGYSVVVAADGETALSQLRNPELRVDLLLTDVVLPGMNGREVADSAAEIRPGLKVLFASGHADDVILQQRILVEGASLLSKPFTLLSLSKYVRDALNR